MGEAPSRSVLGESILDDLMEAHFAEVEHAAVDLPFRSSPLCLISVIPPNILPYPALMICGMENIFLFLFGEHSFVFRSALFRGWGNFPMSCFTSVGMQVLATWLILPVVYACLKD